MSEFLNTIDEILELNKRIKTLEVIGEDRCNTVTRLRDKIDELEAENEALREALDKLARLGNEPHYGNSHGNVIAQKALEKK